MDLPDGPNIPAPMARVLPPNITSTALSPQNAAAAAVLVTLAVKVQLAEQSADASSAITSIRSRIPQPPPPTSLGHSIQNSSVSLNAFTSGADSVRICSLLCTSASTSGSSERARASQSVFAGTRRSHTTRSAFTLLMPPLPILPHCHSAP